MSTVYEKIQRAEEISWINPRRIPFDDYLPHCPVSAEDVKDASGRLRRFAPAIEKLFPETVPSGGIIESPLVSADSMKKELERLTGDLLPGRMFLKLDSNLPISGSVKARGGIYEVLKHTEDLAIQKGFFDPSSDSYDRFASPEMKKALGSYKVEVGSTGNLGLSIGIMSSALGYHAVIHMSSDAAQWKKDLLREKGAEVVEYAGDYGSAVAAGRKQSESDPSSYFVDDENSRNLFCGYAVAGERLKEQFRSAGIRIDGDHPLFVYIPCGVGGAPGGISFGLKLAFGDAVHCFFAEPVQACCMLLGLSTGKMNGICVQDAGLTGKTEADGLAVGRPSALVSSIADRMIDGEFTVADRRLDRYLGLLWKSEKIFIEPSSCAAFQGPYDMMTDPVMTDYLRENGLTGKMPQAVHLVWATGGSMVPDRIRKELLK